jgi:hypothetical protein
MSLLAVLVTIPLGDWLSRLPKAEQQVPKPFVESTRLPGKAPEAARDLVGSWKLAYSEDDAQIDDHSVELLVNLVVEFKEDGTYQLKYAARWGNPPIKHKDSRGVDVDESGTWKVSSDVLILDPLEVTRHDVVKNKAVDSIGIANEKHLFVVHWEPKRIHLAGRCAPYQVDPICKDWQVENAWFTFKGKPRR